MPTISCPHCGWMLQGENGKIAECSGCGAEFVIGAIIPPQVPNRRPASPPASVPYPTPPPLNEPEQPTKLTGGVLDESWKTGGVLDAWREPGPSGPPKPLSARLRAIQAKAALIKVTDEPIPVAWHPQPAYEPEIDQDQMKAIAEENEWTPEVVLETVRERHQEASEAVDQRHRIRRHAPRLDQPSLFDPESYTDNSVLPVQPEM